jgi:hypothetical protein
MNNQFGLFPSLRGGQFRNVHERSPNDIEITRGHIDGESRFDEKVTTQNQPWSSNHPRPQPGIMSEGNTIVQRPRTPGKLWKRFHQDFPDTEFFGNRNGQADLADHVPKATVLCDNKDVRHELAAPG